MFNLNRIIIKSNGSKRIAKIGYKSLYRLISRFEIQLIASGVIACMPSNPWLNFLARHSFTMWFMVWSPLPQSQTGLSRNPHLCRRAPHRPWPVRSLFSVNQVLRGRFIPRTPSLESVTSFWFDADKLVHSLQFTPIFSTIVSWTDQFPGSFNWWTPRL